MPKCLMRTQVRADQQANGQMSYTDSFGFLPVPDKLEFASGSVTPVPKFEEVCETVARWVHPDGHVYPPIMHTRQKKLHWKKDRKVPLSDRPALLRGWVMSG